MEGIRLGTFGTLEHSRALHVRIARGPYHPVRDDPLGTYQHLWADFPEWRLYLCKTRSGEFAEEPMETNPTFVDREKKIMYIFDPMVGINACDNSRRLPCLTVPPAPSLLRRIMYWGKKSCCPILQEKREVGAAFYQIPLPIDMLSRPVYASGPILWSISVCILVGRAHRAPVV